MPPMRTLTGPVGRLGQAVFGGNNDSRDALGYELARSGSDQQAGRLAQIHQILRRLLGWADGLEDGLPSVS